MTTYRECQTGIPRPPCGGRRSVGGRFPPRRALGLRSPAPHKAGQHRTDSLHYEADRLPPIRPTDIHITRPANCRPHAAKARQVFNESGMYRTIHSVNCRPHAASTAIALRTQGTVLIAYGLAHRWSTVATRTLRPPHGGRGTAAKVPGLPAGARMDG